MKSATGSAGLTVVLITMLIGLTAGCTWMSYLGSTDQGQEYGKTWYVGGAGPVGSVAGTLSVPRGLRQAGYRGAIETFGWQSVVGWTLRDQMDRERNEGQARRLAGRIEDYVRSHPGRRVNIIALSAGTGITTWALEALPEDVRVGTVVYLASSLSRQYDLSEALKRVDGKLYCFYSPRDPVLKYGVPVAGSVDRELFESNAAGSYGFAMPPGRDARRAELYRRLRNRPYRDEYAEYGYHGLHTDGTAQGFVAKVIAPLLKEPLQPAPPTARSDAPAVERP